MAGEKKLLTDIARKHDLLPIAKRIWREHPLLEQMAMALADYIGLHAQDSGGAPLLETALVDAIASYEALEGKVVCDDDNPSVTAYMREMVQRATGIFSQNISVQTPSGDVRWLPFDSSACEFLSRYPGATVQVTSRKPALAAPVAVAAIMIKIVPYSLLDQTSAPSVYDDVMATA